MLSYLALVEGLSLNLPLLLQPIDNILVAPADLVRETLHNASPFSDLSDSAQKP